jgi:hypothetical protein
MEGRPDQARFERFAQIYFARLTRYIIPFNDFGVWAILTSTPLDRVKDSILDHLSYQEIF